MRRSHKARDDARQMVARIGVLMDADVFPEILDGGFVTLGSTRHSEIAFPSKEIRHEYVARGPASGQGQGTASGQGKTGEAPAQGPPGSTPPILRNGHVTDRAQEELAGVERHYELWRRSTPDGLRIGWSAGLVRGLSDRAEFLTDVRAPDGQLRVASWAWWDHGIRIGPRHTNYDGSACVFELRDWSWTSDSPLLDLFDMTVVWAFRHLHLRLLGRWPGRQILHTTFERILETRPGELCGCGGTARYEDCCQPNDRAKSALEVAMEFQRFTGGRTRRLEIPAAN